MEKVVKKLVKSLIGEVEIPSDKSISHRAVMFASLAQGESIIRNFSKGADCCSTVRVCRDLGVDIEYLDEKTLKVSSCGKLQQPAKSLDCGNSGTTMRLISGILAGQEFNSTLVGDESLSKRPMKRIIEPLSKMGAKIEANDKKAPLNISGANLVGIDFESNLSSAQVKSCVLLAGLHADGTTRYTEPIKSRDHTERMLSEMGAHISIEGNSVSIRKSSLSPINFEVPGDISSAAFFIVAGLIVPNSDIVLRNVGVNPTRTGILDVVSMMGGQIELFNKRSVLGEPVADLRIKYSPCLKGCLIEGELIPRLIDEIPVIAVLATQAEGQTVIRNAEDLRNKEADRISAVVSALKAFGADVEEIADGFVINGKTLLSGAKVPTFHDHRLAMSYYVAGLVASSEVVIDGFEWISISFPEFENLMGVLFCGEG